MPAIFLLTLRALRRGRRLIVIGALLAVPALVALAYRSGQSHPDGERFALEAFTTLLLPILLPLTALIFATTALGSEVEDGTIIYLALRPVSRLEVVVAKLAAVILVTVIPIELASVVTYFLGVQAIGNSAILLALVLAAIAGSAAYCSLFLALGLIIPRRALIVGLAYVLVWEGTVAGLSSTLATFSVRRYVRGIIDNVAGASAVSHAHLHRTGLGGLSSVIVLVLITAAAAGATTLWLRRMELP
jgi:ABC-2 type transport system permease protein